MESSRNPFNPDLQDKLSLNEKKKIEGVFERIRKDGYEFTVEETQDTLILKTKDEKGSDVEKGFTKVGDKILIEGETYEMKDIIEARVRFPEDNLKKAILKLKNQSR